MMEFFQQLPHLEPYGNPQYFVYVIAATLPIFIGLFFKKRFAWYEVLVSLFFIVTMLVGGKTNQLAALGIYLCWEILLLLFYKHYRKSKDGKWVFYLVSFLSLLPIIFVKVQPAINGTQSLLGFLGISYLTFRSVGIIIELRDGVIKDFTLWEFLRFLLFMPTFSSGPIDRFKRFNENYQAIPERDELMDMLDESVRYIMRGFLYKFILAHVLGETLLPPLKNLALQSGGFFNLYALAVMYTFGLELFFDFAGYSMFALAISNLMGIRSPINFNKPFLSRDLKEFWNRWHMSLSFWFRDFVFMRMVMVLTRKKVFKNRNVTSSMAYIVNMLIMGFWHGVTWYYIAYGLFHGLGLVINDAWVRKKKTLNKERKKAGKAALPENRWIQLLGMVITFHEMIELLARFNERQASFFGQFSVRGYVNYDKHVAKYLKILPDQFSYQAIEDVVKADAEKNTSNNEMGMENYFYNEQIKKDLKKLKDSQKSFTYLKSPEYNDLQLVLTQFSKSKVNPIFIIPPVNKKWMDYAGLREDMYQQTVQKIRYQLESQGFTNIADFSKDGGEPFFMKDTIHLGWLGWLAFDKAVDPFLSNPTPAPTYHLNERFFSKDWATYDGDVKEFQ